MTSDKGVVERLRPSAVVDETVGMAVRALRAEGFAMLAGSLNEWLVENNSLKSEAQARIETLEQALSGLVKKLDAIDKPVTDIFVFAGAHGYHYDGPNYTDELITARAALSPSTNGADNDDIPEDVLAQAEEAYQQAIYMTTSDEPQNMVRMVARAILAERLKERAACLSFVENGVKLGTSITDWRPAEIAKAIRSRP